MRFFVLIPLLAVLTLGSCQNGGANRKLPILGFREPITKVVDGETVIDTIYHTIPDFRFTNQDSAEVTNEDFSKGIYIANFFFTNCPSICPTMQRNLLKVYQQYAGNDKVRFLSHSIDFRNDSPEILKNYANKLGVTDNRWQFVCGSKEDIYGIAEKYMVFTKEDSTVPGGYDHSGYFILVDHNRHIRGAYDGTELAQIDLMLEELEILLKEYE